jgi:hypothetical protein
MKKKIRTIMIVASAQYVAIAIGMCWGYLYLVHSCWISPGFSTGALSFLAFGIEALRFMAKTGPTPARWRTACACVGLCLYCGHIMWADPFFNCDDDRHVIELMVLLMPFLLAINLFVRSRAWLAVLASIILFATSIAMLIHNAGCRGGAGGFFTDLVY